MLLIYVCTVQEAAVLFRTAWSRIFFILLFLKTILNLQKRSEEVTIPDPVLNWGCLYCLFDAPTRVTELGVIIGSLCLWGTAYPKQFLNYHWHETVRRGSSWECLDTAAKTSSPMVESPCTEGVRERGQENAPGAPRLKDKTPIMCFAICSRGLTREFKIRKSKGLATGRIFNCFIAFHRF